MRVIAPRFPFVCGPDDYSGRLDFHIDRVRAQSPLYFPNLHARLTFMHSQDAAESLSFLLKDASPTFRGPVNCASPDAISMAELVQWIEESVGRKAVLANEESDGNRSPYGDHVDSFTSTRLLASLGYEALRIRTWMPELIAERTAQA